MQSVDHDSWARLNPYGSGLSAEPEGMRGMTGVYLPKRLWLNGCGVAQNRIKQMEQPLKSGGYPSNGVGKTNAEKERLNIWLKNYLLGG